MLIRYVSKRIFLNIFYIILIVFSVIVLLQLSSVQKYLINLIVEADFEEIDGFFPLSFNIKNLSINNTIHINKASVNNRKIKIDTLNIKKDNFLEKINLRQYIPLINQKVIESITIKNMNNMGAVKYVSGKEIYLTGSKVKATYSISNANLNINFSDRFSVNGSVDLLNEKFYGNIYIPGVEGNISTFIRLDNNMAVVADCDNRYANARLRYDKGFLYIEFLSIKDIANFKPFKITQEGRIDNIEAYLYGGKITVSDIDFKELNLGKWKFQNINLNKSGILTKLNGTGYFDKKMQTVNFDIVLDNIKYNQVNIPSTKVKLIYHKKFLKTNITMNKKNVMNMRMSLDNWIIGKSSILDIKAEGVINNIHEKLKGKIKYNFNVGGNIQNPICKGTLQFSNGVYVNSKYGIYLKNITLNAYLKDNSIVIDKIFAIDDIKGGGNIKGQGKIYKKNGNPYADIKLDISRLDFLNIRGLESTVSGGIKIFGDINNGIKINGEVVSNSPILDVSGFINMGNYGIGIINIPKKEKAKTKITNNFLRNIQVDVKLRLLPNLRITGFGIESIWKGGFSLVGKVPNINCKGEVVLDKGTIDIVGKKFDLNDGKMSICTGIIDPPEVILDVSAVRLIEKKKVGAKLVKNENVSEIQYFSTPYMEKKDILSYILFGKSSSEISTNEMFAIVSIINNTSGGILDKLKKIMLIDTIEINKRHNEESGKDYSSIKIGKKIGRFNLSIDKGNEANDMKITIDTNLTKNTKASISKDESLSAGIFWEKRY